MLEQKKNKSQYVPSACVLKHAHSSSGDFTMSESSTPKLISQLLFKPHRQLFSFLTHNAYPHDFLLGQE